MKKIAVSKVQIFLIFDTKVWIGLVFLLSIYTLRFSVTLLRHSKRRYIRKKLIKEESNFVLPRNVPLEVKKGLKYVCTFGNNEHLIQQKTFRNAYFNFLQCGEFQSRLKTLSNSILKSLSGNLPNSSSTDSNAIPIPAVLV